MNFTHCRLLSAATVDSLGAVTYHQVKKRAR